MTLDLEFKPWMGYAKCVGVDDPDVFFPEQYTPTEAARQVCASCLVRIECLQHAIDGQEAHGIFGGLSVAERRKIATEGAPVASLDRNRLYPLLAVATEDRALPQGRALTEARHAAGLSQKRLATQLRLSAATICQWERGNQPISARHLARLVEILGPFGGAA